MFKSLIELSNIEIIDENDVDALFFMILIYISDKKPDLAGQKYEELIQISDNLDYKLRIAAQYYESGFEEESLKIFDYLRNSEIVLSFPDHLPYLPPSGIIEFFYILCYNHKNGGVTCGPHCKICFFTAQLRP
mgnify:CR=1 FL=1